MKQERGGGLGNIHTLIGLWSWSWCGICLFLLLSFRIHSLVVPYVGQKLQLLL